MGNMIISNARKALEYRIDRYFDGEEEMDISRSVVEEWLDSQAAITYFESASQFDKEHREYVRELEETIIDLDKCCSDLRKENDRLEEALSLAEADRNYTVRELDKVTKQLAKSRRLIVKLRDELNLVMKQVIDDE